jgi:hypothetical protein
MPQFPLPLTDLIHDNLSVLMAFAYSRPALAVLRRDRIVGGWKHLDKALFEVAEKRAIKALIELALFLRALDDEQDIAGRKRSPKSQWTYGEALDDKGTRIVLDLREVANKVLHAASFEFHLAPTTDPKIICIARPDQLKRNKWVRAELELIPIAAACGMLVS